MYITSNKQSRRNHKYAHKKITVKATQLSQERNRESKTKLPEFVYSPGIHLAFKKNWMHSKLTDDEPKYNYHCLYHMQGFKEDKVARTAHQHTEDHLTPLVKCIIFSFNYK